jgi:hypothetical protein
MKDFFKKIYQSLSGLGIITICALLGAWGGQEKKWLRRFVYPAILTLYAIYIVQNWWVLTIYTISGWLSMGYGIPSYLDNPNHPNYDEGSTMGAFFYKIFRNSELWANIITRGTVGILISLSMLSVPIIIGKWIAYLLCSVVIVGIWASVSWRGFGITKVKLYGKEVDLLNVDLVVYTVTSCAILTIIHLI